MAAIRLALAAAVSAALPTPEDYHIEKLPDEAGDEASRGFKQYAGHMPLGDAGGTELFFWFVESAGNPAKDPVVFWTNGGPGSSSVAYGFWTEHGPYRPSTGGKPVAYDYSWNKIANVIYLENPTGVGFSFSKDTKLYENITDDLAASQSHAFLGKFFEVFSDFAKNPFFVTGESYGGHYVPNLAEKLLDDGLGLDMRGFLIGNPGIQSDWYYNVDEYAFVTCMWSHGLIPAPEYLAAYDACGWKDFFTNCTGDFTHPSTSCKKATDAAVKLVPDGLDLYNVFAPTCHAKSRRVAHTPFLKHLKESFGVEPPFDPCLSEEAFSYMHREDVAAAVHAKVDAERKWPENPKNWYYNEGVEGSKKDISVLFPKFFEKAPHWKIWVVSGDADAAVPFMGTQRWMECLGRDLLEAQAPWMMDGEVAGTLRRWDQISLLLVKGCGHTIPTYCPKAGYKFFEDYLAADSAGDNVLKVFV